MRGKYIEFQETKGKKGGEDRKKQGMKGKRLSRSRLTSLFREKGIYGDCGRAFCILHREIFSKVTMELNHIWS